MHSQLALLLIRCSTGFDLVLHTSTMACATRNWLNQEVLLFNNKVLGQACPSKLVLNKRKQILQCHKDTAIKANMVVFLQVSFFYSP